MFYIKHINWSVGTQPTTVQGANHTKIKTTSVEFPCLNKSLANVFPVYITNRKLKNNNCYINKVIHGFPSLKEGYNSLIKLFNSLKEHYS